MPCARVGKNENLQSDFIAQMELDKSRKINFMKFKNTN